MWLTGQLTPDFKTIANFRKDNGRAIRKVCRQFIVLCRRRGAGIGPNPVTGSREPKPSTTVGYLARQTSRHHHATCAWTKSDHYLIGAARPGVT
jgi:hypothetical protein